MISFPHIYLLHNVIAYVEHVNTDPEVPEKYRIQVPVTFQGTVKLHGSNCGVVLDVQTGRLQAQSRETDLTPTADYKGFAKFVEEHTTPIRGIFDLILEHYEPEDVQSIALYGEWVGAGVVSKTKGAAVAKFDPKHWALFAVQVKHPGDGGPVNVSDLLDGFEGEGRIGNVRRASNWSITINFNDPASIEAAKAEAAKVITAIEAQCPYGALYGLDGAGEGIVWMPTGEFQGREDLYWKFKTEAHSVTREPKVRKERPVLPAEVQEAIADFVAFAVTYNRLEQGIDALEQQGLGLDKRNTGKFIQWVAADVERECALDLEEAGLQWSQVSNQVTTKARGFFLEAVEKGST